MLCTLGNKISAFIYLLQHVYSTVEQRFIFGHHTDLFYQRYCVVVSPLLCVMCPYLMFPYLVCFLSLFNVIIS